MCVCVSLDDICSKHADRTCGGNPGGLTAPGDVVRPIVGNTAVQHVDAHDQSVRHTMALGLGEALGSRRLRRNESVPPHTPPQNLHCITEANGVSLHVVLCSLHPRLCRANSDAPAQTGETPAGRKTPAIVRDRSLCPLGLWMIRQM